MLIFLLEIISGNKPALLQKLLQGKFSHNMNFLLYVSIFESFKVCLLHIIIEALVDTYVMM